MKRDFDCDTCSWFENGRCTNFNRSAYYPCPEWLRRFDPDKYTCDQEMKDCKTKGSKMRPIKMISFKQNRQFLRYLEYLRKTKKEPTYIWREKVRFMQVPAMDENCNVIKGRLLHVSDPLPLPKLYYKATKQPDGTMLHEYRIKPNQPLDSDTEKG